MIVISSLFCLARFVDGKKFGADGGRFILGTSSLSRIFHYMYSYLVLPEFPISHILIEMIPNAHSHLRNFFISTSKDEPSII